MADNTSTQLGEQSFTPLRELPDATPEQTSLRNVILAPNTSARIGGPADALVTVRSGDELARAVQTCWEANLPMTLIGGGSNVLVSDKGLRGIVILR